MYLDALPIPAALSDSGRPLPRHSALSLEYFHRTDHRRRQRAQPIGLSQCTAHCEKRPQRSPLSRLKMPVRTKGNAASFGNSLLRQITLKAKSANRIADFLHHSGYYIISHNLHFYDNQRRILYSITIIMSIAPRKSELIYYRRCAFAAGSGGLQHIGDGLARGLDGLYRGLADGNDGHESLSGGDAEDRLDLGGVADSHD